MADDHTQIGNPVDRSRWGMTAPTSDASYNPSLNEITFPAGILQPPAFSVDAVDAINYGAIGVVIGHEISHGFDDQGAQFDDQGRLHNWWSADDLAKFQARGQCVVDHFIAWGQFRGDAIRPETQRLMIQGDPHPIAKYRVIGPLSNIPAFQAAFSCKADAAMVRPTAQRCEIW